ncbi:MAG: hypothetical protein ACPGYV_10230, partial [Phycisphaeraceae bacterium]
RSNRSEMIGLFLATLELVRQRLVRVLQDETTKAAAPGANVRLVLVPEAERATPADDDEAAAISGDAGDGEGSSDYDWPDEESRLRFERRERLRATLAAKAEAEERGEPFDVKAYKKRLAEERGGELDELDEEELAIEADDEDNEDDLNHADDE